MANGNITNAINTWLGSISSPTLNNTQSSSTTYTPNNVQSYIRNLKSTNNTSSAAGTNTQADNSLAYQKMVNNAKNGISNSMDSNVYYKDGVAWKSGTGLTAGSYAKNGTVSDGTTDSNLKGIANYSKNGNLVGQNITYDQTSNSINPVTTNTNTYSTELMKALMENNEQTRQAMIDAILQNLDAVKGTYKNQIQQVIDEYQKLIDENEVKKAQSKRVMRENQANRGQLDSGMGRQELLDMNIGYDNASTELNAAKVAAVNEIMNLIKQAESEANTNIANANSTYNNALLEYQLANA